MKDGVKNILINIFSLDEKRISTIIIFTCIFMVIAVYQILKTLDISENIRVVLIYCLGFIAGVNSIQSVVDAFGNKNI